MTEEEKIEFVKYLEGRTKNPRLREKRSKGYKSYVSWFDIKDKPKDNLFKDNEIWISLAIRHFKNIYRADSVGKWKQGFYKKVGKFYFSLFWYRTRIDGSNVREVYRVLKERTALRRILSPKTDSNELFYNLVLDVFGPSQIFSCISPMTISSKSLACICHSVMKMSYREIIDKYEKTIDYLILHTRPKGGIIINRKFGKEFRGRSGAAHGRMLARRCEFLELYDSEKSTRENLEYMKSKGLNISYGTYLKYKKEIFLHADDSIKKLELI